AAGPPCGGRRGGRSACRPGVRRGAEGLRGAAARRVGGGPDRLRGRARRALQEDPRGRGHRRHSQVTLRQDSPASAARARPNGPSVTPRHCVTVALPLFTHSGAPSLVAGLMGVEPMNTAHSCPELGLVIVAVQPSPVSVMVGMAFPADTAYALPRSAAHFKCWAK